MHKRREFLEHLGHAACGMAVRPCCQDFRQLPFRTQQMINTAAMRPVRLFLCGDVMTGRGIDQILRHPSDDRLYEFCATSALEYLRLAERRSGPIPRSVSWPYIWGDALEELDSAQVDLRIINLETSITGSEEREPKGINYRMHPANAACITVAKIDCCVLANNHVLDWGLAGLTDTLNTLRDADVATTGAGENLQAALEPATLHVGRHVRVLVFAVGCADSGIPRHWAAGPRRAGVALLPDLSKWTTDLLAARIQRAKQPGDIVLLSIHWGGNWGYSIPPEHRSFAHSMIDSGTVDLIHGHSSHHPKAIEVYRDKLILFGCGDFVNDYEGISGYREFRIELILMYLPAVQPATGKLVRLDMTALEIKRFRLQRASTADSRWLRDVLDRECAKTGARVTLQDHSRMALECH